MSIYSVYIYYNDDDDDNYDNNVCSDHEVYDDDDLDIDDFHGVYDEKRNPALHTKTYQKKKKKGSS